MLLEFKFAKKTSDIKRVKAEGIAQLQEREYTKGYDSEGRRIIETMIVADDEHRLVII